MKVRELIEALRGMDPERPVILQKDAEGNGYSPLEGVDDNTAYSPRSTWSGNVWKIKLSEEDREAGYSDEDLAPDEALPCVVLYPVN